MSTKLVVLVVEDDHAVRSVVVRVLSNWGYVVLEADRIDAAFKVAREADLAIVDCNITGTKDGLELVASLRQSMPAMPVIGMSGDSVAAEFLEAGALMFLPKPVDVSKLEEMVGSLIGRPVLSL